MAGAGLLPPLDRHAGAGGYGNGSSSLLPAAAAAAGAAAGGADGGHGTGPAAGRLCGGGKGGGKKTAVWLPAADGGRQRVVAVDGYVTRPVLQT